MSEENEKSKEEEAEEEEDDKYSLRNIWPFSEAYEEGRRMGFEEVRLKQFHEVYLEAAFRLQKPGGEYSESALV